MLLNEICRPECAFYIETMTTKEVAIQTIKNLPDDATWDDVLERINFVAGVRKGLLELDAGKAIPHDQIRAEYAQWLTD